MEEVGSGEVLAEKAGGGGYVVQGKIQEARHHGLDLLGFGDERNATQRSRSPKGSLIRRSCPQGCLDPPGLPGLHLSLFSAFSTRDIIEKEKRSG